MYSYSYKQDRIELVSPGKQAVSKKLESIYPGSIQRQNPLLSEGNYIPPRVLRSVLMRYQTLYGRYE